MDESIKKIACPNCGGRMLYDIARRRVVCQFCGCIKMDDGSYGNAPDHEITGVVKGTALYEYDTVEGASVPFCGSVHVDITGLDHNTPSGIIPFKVDAEGVETALRFPIGNNVLVPKPFKPLVTHDKYHAVYLPLWVVSTDISVTFEAVYGNKPKRLNQKTDGTLRL